MPLKFDFDQAVFAKTSRTLMSWNYTKASFLYLDSDDKRYCINAKKKKKKKKKKK